VGVFFTGLIGSVLPTTDDPDLPFYNFGQLGYAANGKNGNYGFSSWINVFWKLDLSIPGAPITNDEVGSLNAAFLCLTNDNPADHSADINVDLDCPCVCKPPPYYNYNYNYNYPQ